MASAFLLMLREGPEPALIVALVGGGVRVPLTVEAAGGRRVA